MTTVRFMGGPAHDSTQDTHYKASRMPPTILPKACPIPIRDGMYVKGQWLGGECQYKWTPVGSKHGRI